MTASPDVEVVVTEGLGNATYLLGVGADAIVVDPPRDVWRLEPILRARGWRLRHVVETHVHNDYLSGALEAVAAFGATVAAPGRGRYAFPHRPVDEGDEVTIDGLRLIARATPGHTPEHLAWDVRPEGSARPTAVLTGGSLLVGSVGRTDLLGGDRLDELTAAQFRSLRALAALPDDTAIWPTHGTGSFCAAGPAAHGRTTTIGSERWMNPLFRLEDPAAFRAALVAGFGPYPSYYAAMAPMNRTGPRVLGAPATPRRLDVPALRAALDAGARLVDGRPKEVVSEGHIPGALAVPLDDTFASYVGWLLPVGTPMALLLPEPLGASTDEAVGQLLRIGFDEVVGVLDGGFAAWVDAGGPTVGVETTTAQALAAELRAGARPVVVDVRDPRETRDDGTLEGSILIPVGELADRLDEVPTGSSVTVVCKSGTRAAIAANVLERAGCSVRVVMEGGVPDVLAAVPERAVPPALQSAAARETDPASTGRHRP